MNIRIFLATLCAFSCLNDPSYGDVSKKDSFDYQRCITLAEQDITAAHTKAAQWATSEGSYYAYHCLAIVQYKLEHFADAALSLSKMRSLIPESEYSVRHNITLQQVRAWQQAGALSKSLDVLTPYITELRTLDYSDVDLSDALLLRVSLYNKTNQYLDALQDADHALTLKTNVSPILLSRARTYMFMEEKALAKKDIETVLALNNTNKEALVLLQQLK